MLSLTFPLAMRAQESRLNSSSYAHTNSEILRTSEGEMGSFRLPSILTHYGSVFLIGDSHGEIKSFFLCV